MDAQELAAKEDQLNRDEQRAAAFGTAGRWICAALFLAMCVAIGFQVLVWQIVGVSVFVAVLIAYIVGVMIVTKKLEALRAEIRPELEFVESDMFKSLAEDFSRDDMKFWSDTVVCKSVRAFRDDVTMEVEFTFDDGRLYSAIFENDRAAIVVGMEEEAAYIFPYRLYESTKEIYNVVKEQIVELMEQKG